jgi:hypothetical protein
LLAVRVSIWAVAFVEVMSGSSAPADVTITRRRL